MPENKTDKLSTPYFENLNGLRFFGAFSVFLFHAFTLGREMWGDFFQGPVFESLAKVFSKGHHGVALFFVLSGFLITYLLLHEAKQKGKINAFAFFMRRLLRIWPLYFIIVIFGFFVFPALPNGVETSNSLLNYSLFLSNFEEIWNGWQDSVSFLSVTWSVSIEEQFYMAWVVLIAAIPPMRKGKLFIFYFTALIVANLIFRTYYVGNERIVYFHSLSVVSDLAIGAYLSYLCFHFNLVERLKSLSKIKIILTYVIGTAMILLSRKIFIGYGEIIERLCIGLFFAFVIFEQVFCLNSFYKADKVPGGFNLGEISYGLYMYHCIIIFFTQQMIVDFGLNDSIFGFFLFLFISALMTISISRLSYNYIEKPLLSLKKKFR